MFCDFRVALTTGLCFVGVGLLCFGVWVELLWVFGMLVIVVYDSGLGWL